MIAPFIPYFIAANLATDTSSWSKGPEYVFTTSSETSFFKGHHDADQNMTVILETVCQPKGIDSLNCLVSIISRSESTPLMQYKSMNETEPIQFEAKFDATGVVNLTVSESLKPMKVLGIKRFVSVFSVGVDLSNPTVLSAEGTTEKSTLGECDGTVIKVESYNASGNPKHLDGQTYDLYPIPLSNNERRVNVVIDKIRDPSKCSGKDRYYFFFFTPTPIEVKSSVSKISIGESGSFESFTESVSQFKHTEPDNPIIVYIFESAQTILSEVREAVTSLPSIPDPKIISMNM